MNVGYKTADEHKKIIITHFLHPNRLDLSIINENEFEDQNDFLQIKLYVDSIFSESDYISAINKLSECINNSPYQVVNSIQINYFIQLSQCLLNSNVQNMILSIFCYIFQISDSIDEIVNFITHSDFFDIYNTILKDSFHNDSQILVIDSLSFLVGHEEIRLELIDKEIIPSINQLANLNEYTDYSISFFYSKITKYSFGELTTEFYNMVSPVLFQLCSSLNSKILGFSFKSLRNLSLHSPLPFFSIMELKMIGYISKCLNSDDSKLRRNSIKLFLLCVQFIDFPYDMIFVTDILDQIFEALKRNDEIFSEYCISVIRTLVQIPDKNTIKCFIDYVSQINFLEFFCNQSFIIKTKMIQVFDIILSHSTNEQIPILFSDNSLSYLCELVNVGDPAISLQILKILSRVFTFHDVSFSLHLSQLLFENDSIEQINQLMNYEDLSKDNLSFISSFLNTIKSIHEGNKNNE